MFEREEEEEEKKIKLNELNCLLFYQIFFFALIIKYKKKTSSHINFLSIFKGLLLLYSILVVFLFSLEFNSIEV